MEKDKMVVDIEFGSITAYVSYPAKTIVAENLIHGIKMAKFLFLTFLPTDAIKADFDLKTVLHEIANLYFINQKSDSGRKTKFNFCSGFKISIQANSNAMCEPEEDNAKQYFSFELGYPSEYDDVISNNAECPVSDGFINTVYPYVPSERLGLLILKHDGKNILLRKYLAKFGIFAYTISEEEEPFNI